MVKIYRDLFRLNVGFIAHQETGYSRAFEFKQDEFLLPPDLIIHQLEGTVIISRSTQGLYIDAHFLVHTPATCSRCLTEFSLALTTEFNELYFFPYQVIEETEFILPEDGYIDLSPLIREYIILETPINPKCSETCAGGDYVEEDPPEFPENDEVIDPRFAALKQLLDDENASPPDGAES